jgi:hypothetical protein
MSDVVKSCAHLLLFEMFNMLLFEQLTPNFQQRQINTFYDKGFISIPILSHPIDAKLMR